MTEGNYVGKLHSSTKAVARVAEEYTQHPVSAFTYNDSETLTPEQAGNDFGAVTKHDVDISKDITLKAGDKLIVDMEMCIRDRLETMQYSLDGSLLRRYSTKRLSHWQISPNQDLNWDMR